MIRWSSAIFLAILIQNFAYSQAKSLPRSTPESQGVSSSAVSDFVEQADKTIDSLHSFMLVRHGKVVAEGWWAPYDATTPHQLYSLSKSFTSTAVGLAIAEGKLSLDDQVSTLFEDQLPSPVSNNLKAMRIRDLLSMSTGHDSEPKVMGEQNWTKIFLAHPVPFKPGTHFLYNTPATYICSAAVQKKTGQTVMDFLTPRLFEPLGIEGATWGMSPEGVSLGGYGLNVRTEDIAKFGKLYLQKGDWDGKQLIPANWIDQATSRQTSNGSNPKSDWDQGYGYQFWRCRNNGYRGDGAFGQYCIVLPEKDAVIAITSGVRNMQAVLDLVWDKLLPAMTSEKLPENATSQSMLVEQLKKLQLPEVQGKPSSSVAAKLVDKVFKFESNDQKIESLTLTQADGKLEVSFVVAGQKIVIPSDTAKWLRQNVRWASESPTAIATSTAWTSDDSCTLKLCYAETPFIQTLKIKFDQSTVQIETESNVSFGPTKLPAITGKSL
ncbi:MAG: serine hydrolase [Pirellulales bacterium]